MKHFGKWLTHFERSNGTDSPRYRESIQYFRQFEKYSPFASLTTIGRSPQGRSIECLIVSSTKDFSPDKARKSKKTLVFIQNGIHAGEIEGKDACMLLLREMLVDRTTEYLLDHLNLLIIPILNVDGHERVSAFNRPNQNGPKTMGWRTNSRNLNLNRDYMKVDTPEVRASIKVFTEWRPDFFVDNHTTNGADYQYHITYAMERWGNIDKGLAQWGQNIFLPKIITAVEGEGFLTAPYIQLRNGILDNGIEESVALPRLSTGYAAVQNRLGLLVETHSLKPYENRVRSTLSMNRSVLKIVHKHAKEIIDLNERADSRATTISNIPIEFASTNKSIPFNFKGYRSLSDYSDVLDRNVVRYSALPYDFEIPYYNSVTTLKKIRVPNGYVIPSEYREIIDLLDVHGIHVMKIGSDRKLDVEEYAFLNFHFNPRPYEGRQCVQVQCTKKRLKRIFHKGSYIVPTDQRCRRIIVNLLEPEAPDSLVQWGFFNAWFERKEYAEEYIMEPIAKRMLETKASLRSEFKHFLDQSPTSVDSAARLEFFYQRSAYFDQQEKKYPIVRLVQ
jgi:murein tripeptide amidase MpaA